MKKILILISLMIISSPAFCQKDVVTLGVFHFNFPNLDFAQTEKNDQIDVLDNIHQADIENIVKKIAKFNPDVIVIESPKSRQSAIDSLYNQYLQGKHSLGRNEIEQLGFRLAKQCGAKLHCADAWGEQTESINDILSNESSDEYVAFEESFVNSPDSIFMHKSEPIYKSKGILAELIRLNKPENIHKSLGDYLVGPFKFEITEGDYTGADFESGRWFNRNIRIFRNIQRIQEPKDQRILVIFGAGHMNILNYLFECSPEYNLLDINTYLRQE